MKSSQRRASKFTWIAVALTLCLAAALLRFSLPFAHAQNAEQGAGAAAPAASAGTNATTTAAGTNTTAATGTNSTAATNSPDGSTNQTDGAVVEPKKLPTDMIELSFQNAQVDQIIQWLSENTGKSVVKHPNVNCQVTIVSTKKVARQEAVTLIYRALAMQGFTAIESSKSILIVPEDKEPKMSPELMGAGESDVPGGHQLQIKVFALQHVQAADLSEKVKNVLSEKAKVVTDDRADLLIVTDYNDNLAAAGALIAALDVEKNDDVTVRVIPLKNVNAQDLAKQIAPLYQKLTGKQSKEIIEVSASEGANSLMVLSSGASFKEIQRFATSLDTADAQEKIMKTFLLTNADAQDVAKQLQDLGKNQSDDSSPYRYFYFGGDSNQKDTKKASIVADRRRNALLVQAPPSAMEGIAKTIAALDEPLNDSSLAPRIIPLKYVNAGDIEDVLNELFLKKVQQRSYFDFFDEQPATPDRDVGRLYGKVRITSEAASNALIVTANSQENLDAVMQIVEQLDKPSEAGDTTFHIKLNFGNASKIANRINILFAKGGSPALRPVNPQNPNGNQPPPQQQNNQQSPMQTDDFALEQVVKEDPYYSWLGGQPDAPRGNGSSSTTDRPVSDLVGRVRAVADEPGNSLLITANVHLFAQVSKMIEEMDVPPAQVLIEAKLVQVSADYLDQMGVRYSPDGSQVFSGSDFQNSFMPHAGGSYQKGFGNVTQVNTPFNTGGSSTTASVAQALAGLRSGVLNNTISMDFLIQFLKQKSDATVISEPHITISDNDMAKLFVGQSVPIETGTLNQALGGSSQTFVYTKVGVILEVEPHINVSGDVSLRVRAESSTLDPALSAQGQVILDTAQFRTELTAKTGETLVLGGIIIKQRNNNSYKTPILGSIPGLKYLFGKVDKSDNRKELLVFLRPKVVRSPEEARELLDEVNKKTPLIQKSLLTDPETPPDKAKDGGDSK